MFRGSYPIRFLVLLVALCLANRLQAAEPARHTGPWNLLELAEPPTIEWGEQDGLVREIYYSSVPRAGQPTRVFAYYAKPEGAGPFPAMVLLHGGGGKAFKEWAKLWAERGYVALAMDLAGKGPAGKPLADGGPDQDDKSKFGDFDDAQVKDKWTYHAVAAAIKGHSLLAAQKEVDPARIGVTGISWGGYLTCIVAGVDGRFKVAVPVYGCGFIHKNSCWIDGYFQKMSPELHERWVKYFDPSAYLAGVSCPILFVNGTNDFAYPPDSYQQSYSLVKPELRHYRITVNMPHGHVEGWKPQEIGLFVDSVLKQGQPLGSIDIAPLPPPPRGDTQIAIATPGKAVPLHNFQVHYTTDDGPWQKRAWKSLTLTPTDTGELRAELPTDKPITVFFTGQDERGAIISSAFVGALK